MEGFDREKFFFISNNTISDSGLSGGDRIYIELARRWSQKVHVSLVGCEEAKIIALGQGLKKIEYYVTSPKLDLKNVFSLFGIIKNFLLKLNRGVRFVLIHRKIFTGRCVVYSVSDFYPDLIPAFIVKILNPRSIWIAGFYLVAPAPWKNDSPYKGINLFRGFLYWFSQKLALFLVRRWADFIFVTSEPDRERFVTRTRGLERVIVIRGGVDTRPSTFYLNSGSIVPVKKRHYDACFVGRFHIQKGVLELVDIWRRVVEKMPQARLAMIGNGPLESKVRQMAQELGVDALIDFFGFLDGDAKFEVFRQSKVVVHPAIFDSGGMAAAEAMAWGLPGVAFDLEALKTYYPKGMVKVRPGEHQEFADSILNLLRDDGFYKTVSQDARSLILEEWDWDKRSIRILNSVMSTGSPSIPERSTL